MAVIVRHPEVQDYILSLSLEAISQRGGVTDLFEQGRLILLDDYRLPCDFAAFDDLEKSIDHIADRDIRRRVKKAQSTTFFEGEPPERRGVFESRAEPALRFSDPVRQAVFDVLCKGEPELFDRASAALKAANDELERIFRICFPGYRPFRFIPSIRLTRTLFENLHWDNHSIDDDFQQARIFTNLDSRPRIWHISHHSIDYIRQIYREHDLGRFAGQDPNLMLDHVMGKIMGGTTKTWKNDLPRHQVAFDPGEVWMGESRLISHQIYYGEAAMVYMWFVKIADMDSPDNRFNNRIAALHEEMARAPTLSPA